MNCGQIPRKILHRYHSSEELKKSKSNEKSYAPRAIPNSTNSDYLWLEEMKETD